MGTEQNPTVSGIVTRVFVQFSYSALALLVALLVALLAYDVRMDRAKEHGRLIEVSRLFSRAVSGEMMFGDQRGVDAVVEAFRAQNRLESVKLSSSPLGCSFSLRQCCLSGQIDVQNERRYYLLVSLADTRAFWSALIRLILIAASLIFAGMWASRRIRSEVERAIVAPIMELAADPLGWRPMDGVVIREAVSLSRQLQDFVWQRDKFKEDAARFKLQSSLGELAAQVAHDIRSPIAALEAVAFRSEDIPEDSLILVKSAISRIREVSDAVLKKNRAVSESAALGSTDIGLKVASIPELVEAIVEEKALQFLGRPGLKVETSFEGSARILAKVDPPEFKTVISNLIQNAAEAIDGSGAISVSVAQGLDRVIVRVGDTGRGIAPDVVPLIGARGATFGKANGSGLGLHHAKKNVVAWGGELRIDSSLGKGTLISVVLPKSPDVELA